MENKDEYIAAIDLGTTKIVTLVGRKVESGRYHIIAYNETPSLGVNRGEVQNIRQVVNTVKPMVEDVRRQSGINFTDVYVGIAGQHIKCIENRADVIRNNSFDIEISEEEVRTLEKSIYEIRMDPGEEIIHVIPQSYNVDDKIGIQDPIGMLGKRLEANYHVVIGKTISAEHTQRCINNIGLDLNKLILEPLASATAVLTPDECEVGVAMVDIGGGTTDVVVYYDNVIRHTAVIPFGGNVITNDIKEGCGVLQRQAEQMKVQFGSCFGDLAPDNKIITIPGISGREAREISFRTLAQIIEARMEEIVGAIMYEIERSGYLNKINAGIVFTGGGSQMVHLSQFVKFKTGLDVRIGRPTLLTTDSDKELSRPTFSTSIGLIMKGIEHSAEQSKLQKSEEKEKREIELAISPEDFKEPEPKRKKEKDKPANGNIIQNLFNFTTRIFNEDTDSTV